MCAVYSVVCDLAKGDLLKWDIQFHHFDVLVPAPKFVTFHRKQVILNLPPSFYLVKCTVKILKIGTPEIITITVLQLEQLDFTVQ